MILEMTICDWCRSDGTIRPATGYYWDKRMGRMFDVCYGHREIALQEPGVVYGHYRFVGAIDDESVFSLPNLGIFHGMPQDI